MYIYIYIQRQRSPVQVEDEETQQTKAWRYLFSELKIRGDVEPELAHPLWNSFKRSLTGSGLQESALKLSICCNYSHGSFLSGDHYEQKREALQAYLETKDREWMDDLAADLGLEADGDGDPLLTLEDVMKSGAVRRRGKFETYLHIAQLSETTNKRGRRREISASKVGGGSNGKMNVE